MEWQPAASAREQHNGQAEARPAQEPHSNEYERQTMRIAHSRFVLKRCSSAAAPASSGRRSALPAAIGQPILPICASSTRSQPRDVPAEYDEASQGTATVQRRAYWLEPNALAIAAGRQPRFVASTNTQGLAAVPVTDNPTNTPLSGYQGLYAVVSTNGQSFFLHSGQQATRLLWAARCISRLRASA